MRTVIWYTKTGGIEKIHLTKGEALDCLSDHVRMCDILHIDPDLEFEVWCFSRQPEVLVL